MTLHTRLATAPRRNSYDPTTRRFIGVAATETPVRRRDWRTGELFDEVLDTSRMDLSILNSGRAPFCLDHESHSVRNQIGRIVRAWVENRELLIEVELSDRDDVKPIAADIADGITLNLSIGYSLTDELEDD